MKILLANDTGSVDHFGCLAVSDAHARLIGRAGHTARHRIFVNQLSRFQADNETDLMDAIERNPSILALIEETDAVIVNGEGTIHHGSGLPLLALLGVAQRHGKITGLVNAVFQDTPGFEKVLTRLDTLAVREPRSLAYLQSRGLSARLQPDSILFAGFQDAPPTLEGIVVTDSHWTRNDIGACLEGFAAEFGGTQVALHSPNSRDNWQFLPARLANVDLLVTGRHHGVYLAIISGIPFVALPSNSHKIEGTIEMLGAVDFFVDNCDNLRSTAIRAIENRCFFVELGRRFKAQFFDSPFKFLGIGEDSSEVQELEKFRADVESHRCSKRRFDSW
jgi:hypothetical protein